MSDSAGAATRVAEHECLVVLEHEKGRLVNVSLEILGQARRMADPRGDEVVGLILGEHTEDLAQEALRYGADRVLYANSPLLAHYTSDGHAHVVGETLAQRRPNIVLFGATHNGRDLAGRLAVRLRTGLTADVTALEVEAESGLLTGEVAGFGGGILALVKCPDRRPQMATVRPGVFEALEPRKPRGGIESVPVTLTADMIRSEVLEVVEVESVDLTRAPVIVAAGGGTGGDLRPIERLVELLGGAVGATRVVVDNGWISRDHQIGQTGVSVRPKACVCAGISGAVQFTCGVTGAETVIAIDRDPEAPIFDHADYGVVGDLFEVLDALNTLLAAEESVASDGNEVPPGGTAGETEKGAVRATSADKTLSGARDAGAMGQTTPTGTGHVAQARLELRTVVTVKAVPKSEEVRIDMETMTLDREGARTELNRSDKNAIEMALQLTETHEGEVILLSMGPPLFAEYLRVGIGMGADDAVLLSDRRFAAADTLPTSRTLVEGIRRIGDIDLVLCGEESADSATGQVPPGIAEWLGWPLLTYVTELRVLDDGRLAAKRELSGGHEWIAVSLPAVASVCVGCNSPRFPDFRRKRWAEEKLELKVWNADDLDVDPAELGLAGSPTIVDGVKQAPSPERRRERLEGSAVQVAARLAEHLRPFLRQGV